MTVSEYCLEYGKLWIGHAYVPTGRTVCQTCALAYGVIPSQISFLVLQLTFLDHCIVVYAFSIKFECSHAEPVLSSPKQRFVRFSINVKQIKALQVWDLLLGQTFAEHFLIIRPRKAKHVSERDDYGC